MWKELPKEKQQKWREENDNFTRGYNLTRQESFDISELESMEVPKTKEEKEEKKKSDFLKLLQTTRIKGKI